MPADTSKAAAEAATTGEADTEAATTGKAASEAAATGKAATEAAATGEAATGATAAIGAATEAADISEAATEAADISEVATEAAVTSEVAIEAADIDEVATDASDTGQAASENADQAATKASDDDETAVGTCTGVTMPAKSVKAGDEKHPPEPTIKNHYMGEVNEEKVAFSEQSEQSKEMTRARKVRLMWEKFWNMRLLCPEEKDFKGNQVTSFKEDISKCLNTTSRALFLKLRASAFLTGSGLTSTLSCHLELCLLSAIQLHKLKKFMCVTECVKKTVMSFVV